MAQRVSHLSHMQEDFTLCPCKTLAQWLTSVISVSYSKTESLKTPRPASMAYTVVNSKEILSQLRCEVRTRNLGCLLTCTYAP